MKEKETSFFSDEDWQDLLPTKEVKVGSKTVRIEPFGVKAFKHAIQKVISVQGVFESEGITRANFNTAEKIPKVAIIIMDNIPDLLANASGIPLEDFLRLPISPVVEILNAVIDVNLESQRGLEKNLPALVAKLTSLNLATKKT